MVHQVQVPPIFNEPVSNFITGRSLVITLPQAPPASCNHRETIYVESKCQLYSVGIHTVLFSFYMSNLEKYHADNQLFIHLFCWL